MAVIIPPTSKKPPPGPPTTTVPGTTIMVAPPDTVDVVTVTPLDVVDVVDEDDVACGVGDILCIDDREELDNDRDVLDREGGATGPIGDVPDKDDEVSDTVGERDRIRDVDNDLLARNVVVRFPTRRASTPWLDEEPIGHESEAGGAAI